ncbi:MAG: metal-dependent hydrolase [Xanthomonadaceae bacterium]|jgi:inner membrane protein|nr:metal-dependent hydrolase [Xanthomonadaceae bacterium]
MDSLTQIVLGGAVAAAVIPARHRRAGLVAGAALGTLPDLDSLLLLAFSGGDPVILMTMHRGFSHSLFVLPIVAWIIWWIFRRRGGRVAQAPTRWFWAILLALMTHPLLDAFTVYGTQLWWPLSLPPVMWSSVFIVDPGYTVWLLLACVIAWCARERRFAQYALVAGLCLSSAYLGMSLIVKHQIERAAEQSLTAMGLIDAPRFSVPLPLNTVLWRVVAMTPDGYVIGDRSWIADRGPMQFKAFSSATDVLVEVQQFPSVRRLTWFNHGFMRTQVHEDEVILSDLRMGFEPDYTFNFAVAMRDGEHWREITPRQLQNTYRFPVSGGQWEPVLAALWRRIWHPSDHLLLELGTVLADDDGTVR